MGAPHPQVVAVLERVARSPLPLYHTLPPFVARRIYRDTRAVLAPPSPEVAESKLVLAPGPATAVMMRAYRPKGAARDAVLPLRGLLGRLPPCARRPVPGRGRRLPRGDALRFDARKGAARRSAAHRGRRR